jgi:uncharacterized protein
MDIILTPEEVRVLGCLLEKEMSTPEYYPLTLNALVTACNQKTSRSPVVSYDEKTVLGALARLEKKRLVWQSSLGRVPKYEQSFVKNMKLINSETAVLSMLMLRGPQTIGEIKAHTERLYDFADLEKVNETLRDLIEAGFIVKFPRMPGQKESRYAHLLSGQLENTNQEAPGSMAMDSAIQEGDERIPEMQEELKALRRDFEEFKLKMAAFMEQFK